MISRAPLGWRLPFSPPLPGSIGCLAPLGHVACLHMTRRRTRTLRIWLSEEEISWVQGVSKRETMAGRRGAVSMSDVIRDLIRKEWAIETYRPPEDGPREGPKYTTVPQPTDPDEAIVERVLARLRGGT